MRMTTCRTCGERLLWAVTEGGKRLALNPGPDPAGNQASYRDATGTRLTRQLRQGQEPYGYERRYMPHIATCKPVSTAPPELPPNVIPFRRRQSAPGSRPPSSPSRPTERSTP